MQDNKSMIVPRSLINFLYRRLSTKSKPKYPVVKEDKAIHQHPVRQINIWHQWLMFISLFISSVCDVGYGKKDGECEECPVGTYYKYGQRFTFVPTFKEGSCVACKNGFTTAGPKTLSSRDCSKFTPDLN